METKRFVLLDIDYITKNSKPVIRLFGKLQGENNERSIIAMDKNFKPYMYILPYDLEKCTSELRRINLKKVERIRRKDNG